MVLCFERRKMLPQPMIPAVKMMTITLILKKYTAAKEAVMIKIGRIFFSFTTLFPIV